MKIIIKEQDLALNPEQFLRSVGYGYIRDRRTGHDSFVRRLGSFHYPRLHMYIERSGDIIVFNLHLDQKQASYSGNHMHNAEYEGETVEGEINRLKSLLKQQTNEKISAGTNNSLAGISKGDFEKDAVGQVKKSWWKKFFS